MTKKYLVEEKICPYCWEKTRVLNRWFGLPTHRKCDLCKRVWTTGW